MAPEYRNPSGTDVDSAGFARWTLERVRKRLPMPPTTPLRPVAPDLAFLHENRSLPSVTWIGHASVLVQIGGCNILIDPVFSRRVSPVRFAGPKRHQPPGLSVKQLPPIDVVLISHNHYDHLDRPSVRAVAKQAGGPPSFFVPRGVDRWIEQNVPGVSCDGPSPLVRGAEWHETLHRDGPAGALAFHFLPVQHWSTRSALRRNDTPWGSWAIVHPCFRFWFSGDLGYSDDPKKISDAFGGFDCAAIGIGAYLPRWFMRTQHIDPAEAVQVMLDVNAASAIGIHWGTFPLSDETIDEPPRELATALAARGLPADRFTVLRHGETRVYPLRAEGHKH